MSSNFEAVFVNSNGETEVLHIGKQVNGVFTAFNGQRFKTLAEWKHFLTTEPTVRVVDENGIEYAVEEFVDKELFEFNCLKNILEYRKLDSFREGVSWWVDTALESRGDYGNQALFVNGEFC